MKKRKKEERDERKLNENGKPKGEVYVLMQNVTKVPVD
jgi:hypothetical protein